MPTLTSGRPLTLSCNEETFYYLTNIMGDVVGFTDANGNLLMTIVYEAYGTPYYFAVDTEKATLLSQLNPLYYRGYVTDNETGLYYLQSRYYDMTFGRFINSDDVAYLGASGELPSYNLFAYCENNAVMGFDPTGYWNWGWKDQAALGATVLLIGLAILLAVPTGGASLAVGALALSSTAAVATGSAMVIVGTVVVGNAATQATVEYAKKSKKSDKERSSDKPSWVSRDSIDPNKSAQQNAKELLNNKYGSKWPKGQREYSQIVKWIHRSLRDYMFIIVLERMHKQMEEQP